jgi:hypothetical protein
MTTTRRPLVLADALPVLERTPAVLDAMLRGLPEGWMAAHEGTGTWTPFDVLGHLIQGERNDWMRRLQIILEHADSRAFDPFDRFAQFEVSRGKTLPQLLDEFAMLRAENVRRLRALGLADADLDRRGLHPSLGPVTLRNLLATWVAHDLDHLVQIARVMARQYSDEVGPWSQYLRIISGVPG